MTSTFFVLSSICCSTQTDLSPDDNDFLCHFDKICAWYKKNEDAHTDKEDEDNRSKEDEDDVNKEDKDDANKEDRGLSKRATINSTFLPPKTTISCQEMSF